MSDILIYAIVFISFVILLLMGYAITKMAELMNIKVYYIGFIPVINLYLIGKMIKTIDVSGKQLPWAQWIAPILPLIAVFLYFRRPLGVHIPDILVVAIFLIVGILWLYTWNTFFLTFGCDQKKAFIFTIIGSLFLVPLGLLIWNVRNNKPEFIEVYSEKPKRRPSASKSSKAIKNKRKKRKKRGL